MGKRNRKLVLVLGPGGTHRQVYTEKDIDGPAEMLGFLLWVIGALVGSGAVAIGVLAWAARG